GARGRRAARGRLPPRGGRERSPRVRRDARRARARGRVKLVVVGGGVTALAAAHRAMELARERRVDLDVRVVEARRRLGGTIVTSSLCSWRGKARMALDLVLPRGGGALGGGDDESLGAFVRRRLGAEALERVAQPLVAGIYTADPEELSVAATMPRFVEVERRHRSVILGLRRGLAQAPLSG